MSLISKEIELSKEDICRVTLNDLGMCIYLDSSSILVFSWDELGLILQGNNFSYHGYNPEYLLDVNQMATMNHDKIADNIIIDIYCIKPRIDITIGITTKHILAVIDSNFSHKFNWNYWSQEENCYSINSLYRAEMQEFISDGANDSNSRKKAFLQFGYEELNSELNELYKDCNSMLKKIYNINSDSIEFTYIYYKNKLSDLFRRDCILLLNESEYNIAKDEVQILVVQLKSILNNLNRLRESLKKAKAEMDNS